MKAPPRKFVFFKASLDAHGVDHKPFSEICRDDGDRYFLLDSHPRFKSLRALYLTRPKPPPGSFPTPQARNWGSEMWERLHRWALTADLGDADDGNVYAQLGWLYRWSMELPMVGCTCLDHWVTLLGLDPPDFSSNEALFLWTVAVHNAVNRRLNKKTMKTVDARLRWAA